MMKAIMPAPLLLISGDLCMYNNIYEKKEVSWRRLLPSSRD